MGRHRRALSRQGDALRRPRLLRHRPQAAAQHPAGARARARRQARVRDRSEGRVGLRRLRPDRRGGRRQFTRARRARRRVQARHRRARLQIHLARHASEVRRRLHLHLRGDRARLDLGPRLPVRRRHRDLHRRMRGRDVAPRRLRQDVDRRDDRRLREDLRALSRRPQADVECAPSARLGLAQFQPRAVRALEPRQYRAARRRRGDRAFLGRLRHQAGAGKRDRAGRLPAQRTDHGAGVPPLRGRAPARSAAAAKRGAQLDRMVRGRRALPQSRSGAVHLFAADALAAHQPREPAPARQHLARRRRALVREARHRPRAARHAARRCSCRSACAASS